MGEIVIRPPVKADIHAVRRLYLAAAAGTPSRPTADDVVVPRILSGNQEIQTAGYVSEISVAEVDGRVAGFMLTASPLSWFQKQPSENAMKVLAGGLVEIQYLAVDRRSQGKGVGTQLALHAEKRCLALGRVALHVATWDSNPAAAEWWRHCGYVMGESIRPWYLLSLREDSTTRLRFGQAGVGQRLGFLPLVDGITVDQDAQTVRGLYLD